MKKPTKSALLATALALHGNLGALAAESAKAPTDSSTVDATEREFKKIKAQIGDLTQQINAVPKTATEPGLGAQVVESQKSMERAREAFKAKDWHTVINEINSFLSLSQKPEPETWLRAHFLLARAYEERGQLRRATRAYTQYLATFTTRPAKDLTDLTETFERLVRIATKSSETNQTELKNFLSSIAAMEYPSSVSEELRYLTAVASSNIGKRDLSIGWLTEVDERSSQPETKARAKYFRALIAINGKDWETAADQLESILNMDSLSAKTKDNARLSLGRVYIKQKKPQLALASYNQIAESSESYRDGALEKTYLLIRLGKDDEARSLSQHWLSRYPDHDDATQLRVLSSWMDLRAGDLTAAKNSLEGTTEKLNGIKNTLAKDYQLTSLKHEDAVRLSKLTRGQVASSPELDEILSMYRQLSELNTRLADIDGVERSIIYAMAKGDLRQYKPALANQMEQYDRLVDEILGNGSRLIFIEKARLEGKLTDLDKQKLKASEKRRLALFEKRSQLARHAKRWASWAAPAEQLIKLAREWDKLNAIAAEVGTSGNTSDGTNNTANGELSRVTAKIDTVRGALLDTLRDIRKHQASNLVEQSQINDIIYIIQQYSAALHEESQIISAYEPASGKVLDSLDDSDSQSAWNAWRDAVNTLHANIMSLKSKAGSDIAMIFTRLEKIEKARVRISENVTHLRGTLETYGGESLAGIIAHYDHAISQRIARQYKWSGDLEYLNYAKDKNTQEASDKKQALEMQILSDDLRDIQQGGAPQWPR